jgi:hypothetical protein
VTQPLTPPAENEPVPEPSTEKETLP